MANGVCINIELTLAEAKAMSRLIDAGIAQIKADPTQISNEETLRKAIAAAGRGTEKIKAAMAETGSPLT